MEDVTDVKRVRLFHSNPAEAVKKVKELRDLGYDALYDKLGPHVLRSLKTNPPAVAIVDLSRASSQGRDIGIYVRHYRATLHIPIVFVGGEPGKVAEIKKHLPDAVYTNWDSIKKALGRAISRPPAKPKASHSLLAGYSGRPLVKKLGIKPQDVVVLIDAPNDFPRVLGDLPQGVVLNRHMSRYSDLAIWFVKSQGVLNKRVKKIATLIGKGGLWIVWPKRGSKISSDLTQTLVRQAGLGAGLVDYKVCAVDKIWSGLKFAVRKRDIATNREGA